MSATRKTTNARSLRVTLGALIWIVGIVTLVVFARRDVGGNSVAGRLTHHYLRSIPEFEAAFPLDAPVAAGNSIYVDGGDRGLIAAGTVLSVDRTAAGRAVRIAVYPEFSHDVNAASKLLAYSTAGNVGWVLQTLFPPERVEQITGRLQKRWDEEKARLVAELTPGLQRLLDEAGWLLKEDFAEILKSPEFRTMGHVTRVKGWDENLDVVFRDTVWPTVEARSAPILEKIGDEIIEEVPVWALSWSYAVQSLPFTDNERVARRVRSFIADQAMPIVRKHNGEFRTMASDVLRETFQKEEVLAAIQKAAYEVFKDERFQEAAGKLVKKWVVENERLRELVLGIAEREDIRKPIDDFLAALQPDVHDIANMILLNSDKSGINPDLARVLRRKLLREDEDWVLLELSPRGDAYRAGTPIRGFNGGVR